MRAKSWLAALGLLPALGCGGGNGLPLGSATPIGFEPAVATVIPAGALGGLCAVGFFDGDEWPDVALGHLTDGEVSVLRGMGDGMFDASAPVTSGLASERSAIVRTAFLDLDPFVDLVVVDDDQALVQTYLGRGDGTFDPVLAVPLDLAGLDVDDVQVARIDGDVLDDVVFVLIDRVVVFLAVGDGTLVPAPGGVLLVGTGPARAHVEDSAGPGQLLVVTEPAAGFVHVLVGDGTGAFMALPASPLAVPGEPEVAALVDLDLMFGPDLVVLTGLPVGVRAYLSTGGGAWAPTPQGLLALPGNTASDTVLVRRTIFELSDVILVTFSGVGDLGSTHLSRLRPSPSGDGTVTIDVDPPANYVSIRHVAADVDQDGLTDLVYAPLRFAPGTGFASQLEVRFGR